MLRHHAALALGSSPASHRGQPCHSRKSLCLDDIGGPSLWKYRRASPRECSGASATERRCADAPHRMHHADHRPARRHAPWRYAAATLGAMAWWRWSLPPPHSPLGKPRPAAPVPVSERAGREVGCWIAYRWDRYPNRRCSGIWTPIHPCRRGGGKGARHRGGGPGARGLFTIGEAGWRPQGGVGVAEVGPIPVKAGNRTRPSTWRASPIRAM